MAVDGVNLTTEKEAEEKNAADDQQEEVQTE